MTARERLNEIKNLFGLKTDNELSEFLGTNKLNIDSWVKRNKIPEKWELIIRQKPYSNSIVSGNNNIQISGKNNTVSSVGHNEYDELFELIKEYATPKMIKEIKEKLLKIKEVYES